MNQTARSCTFVCFNEYSLFATAVYALYIKDYYKLDCNVLWRNTIRPLPEFTQKFWNEIATIDLDRHAYNTRSKLQKLISYARISKRIRRDKSIHDYIRKTSFLFIFKDNSIYDSTIVRMFRSETCEITLIEEGSSLYWRRKSKPGILQRLANWVFRIPPECLLNQGENPLVNSIICRQPSMLRPSQSAAKAVYQQSNIYQSPYVWRYLQLRQANIPNNKDSIDVFYFGQPLSEDGFIDADSEIGSLTLLFHMLPENLNIVIKPHPREDENKYQTLMKTSSNISLVDSSIQKIPAELLALLYPDADFISPFSSALVNIASYIPSSNVISCYPLFHYNRNISEDLENMFKNTNIRVLHQNDACYRHHSRMKGFDAQLDDADDDSETKAFQELDIIIGRK